MNRFSQSSGLLLLTLVMFCKPAMAAEIVAGKYAKVYSGSEGLEVTVVPLQGEDKAFGKRYLVAVKGVESRIDDIPLLYQETTVDKGYNLGTTVNDQDFYTFQYRDQSYGGKSFLVFLPESVTKANKVWYDEKKSKKADAKKIVASYEAKVKDGTIAKVQTYEGDDFKAHTNRTFKRAVDDAETPCGGGIGAKVDWSSVPKNMMGKFPLASRCGSVVNALYSLCSDKLDAKMAKKISGITCVVGKSQNLKLGGDRRLMWQVNASADVDVKALHTQLNSLLK